MNSRMEEFDEHVAAALRRTGRRLELDIATHGLPRIGEVKHLRPAFVAALADVGVPDVQPAGRKLSVRSWEPFATKGRLGAYDVLVGTHPRYHALFELKWAHGKHELGWTLWDIFKLVAGRLEYGASCYAIVGAPQSYWQDETVGCSSIYCNGSWSSAELFRRYEKDWKNLLEGGTARPVRVPATIATRLVAAEPIEASPAWELRALAVDVPGFDWLEFDGDWPRGHRVAADS